MDFLSKGRAGWHTLLLLCALISTACDAREEHRYYELNLDISVDGERARFTRYFDCVRKHLQIFFPSPAGLGWTTTEGSLAVKRLSDGSGIAFSSFYPCLHESFDRQTITRPKLWWFDDVETPRRVEFYRWDSYFKQPRARVVFHGGTVRRVEKAVASDPADDLPWLEKPNQPLIALRAMVVPEEVWGRDPILRENLEKIGATKTLWIADLSTPNLKENDPRRFGFHDGYFVPAQINEDKQAIELKLDSSSILDMDVYHPNTEHTLEARRNYQVYINDLYAADYWGMSIYFPRRKVLIYMTDKSINQYYLRWSVN